MDTRRCNALPFLGSAPDLLSGGVNFSHGCEHLSGCNGLHDLQVLCRRESHDFMSWTNIVCQLGLRRLLGALPLHLVFWRRVSFLITRKRKTGILIARSATSSSWSAPLAWSTSAELALTLRAEVPPRTMDGFQGKIPRSRTSRSRSHALHTSSEAIDHLRLC